jgi:hypothetical protein
LLVDSKELFLFLLPVELGAVNLTHMLSQVFVGIGVQHLADLVGDVFRILGIEHGPKAIFLDDPPSFWLVGHSYGHACCYAVE